MADRLCRAEGIEIAKAQGKYKGRKPIKIDWDKFSKLYGEWKSKNITGRDFMRKMDLSANTFTAVLGSMKFAMALPSRPLLNYVIWRTEMPHRAVRSYRTEN